MGKIKEPIVAYKTGRASRRSGISASNLTYTAIKLRSLPPKERNRILRLQAGHAAAMFAAGGEEIIDDSASVIEY